MLWSILSRTMLVLTVFIGLVVLGTVIWLHFIGGQILPVQSNNMQPIFYKNDTVVALPVKLKNVQAGEIVSYHNNAKTGEIVSQRVVFVSQDKTIIRTSADNQKDAQPRLISSKQLIGKTIIVVPWFGNITSLLQQPMTLVVLASLTVSLLFVGGAFRVRRQLTKPRYRLVARY